MFIVRCSDGALYTDVTNNVDAALWQINEGDGKPYTKSRLPVFLAHVEEYMNESDAERRAAAIRRLSREEKEQILALANIGAAGEFAFAG